MGRYYSNYLWVLFFLFFVGCFQVNAPETYKNPILPGFHPDPSICRVGNDYYLANSSFEWFPGIPLYHSKDLVNWEPIGHVIERPNMICNNFNIWAPTIRHYKGLFYVICTERPGVVFFSTSTDPAGDWSDPVYFDIDAKAVSPIDPSLFWDDDGSCWLASNDRKKSGTNKHWVWIQKVDLNPIERNGRKEASFLGERKYITKGSGVGPDNYAEGPHIFKKNGWYYLIVSEGGTWNNHAVSFFRTKNLENSADDWENYSKNPVFTHRDKNSPISATGHGDIVETQKGDWWFVHLGVRKQDDKHKLGRETFLVPVNWTEDNWPVFNPEKGNVSLMEDKRPDLPWTPVNKTLLRDEFDSEELNCIYNFYKEPQGFDWFELSQGRLLMRLLPIKATDNESPAYIARRQQHHNFNVLTQLVFNPHAENEVAGIMASIKNTNNIRIEIGKVNGVAKASVFYVTQMGENKTGELIMPEADSTYFLKLEARDWDFQFYVGITENDMHKVGEKQDARILSSEIAKGFTGSYVGMYCSANGKQTNTKAGFNWFEYEPIN